MDLNYLKIWQKVYHGGFYLLFQGHELKKKKKGSKKKNSFCCLELVPCCHLNCSCCLDENSLQTVDTGYVP